MCEKIRELLSWKHELPFHLTYLKPLHMPHRWPNNNGQQPDYACKQIHLLTRSISFGINSFTASSLEVKVDHWIAVFNVRHITANIHMCNSMISHFQFNFSQKCLYLSVSTYKGKWICKSGVISILFMLKWKDYLHLWQSFSSACTFWTSQKKKGCQRFKSQLSKYLTSHSRFIVKILASSYSMHRHFPHYVINISILSLSESFVLSMHSAHHTICTSYTLCTQLLETPKILPSIVKALLLVYCHFIFSGCTIPWCLSTAMQVIVRISVTMAVDWTNGTILQAKAPIIVRR